jgi:hypothetical protein
MGIWEMAGTVISQRFSIAGSYLILSYSFFAKWEAVHRDWVSGFTAARQAHGWIEGES